MARYSLDDVREFFDRRAHDPRLSTEPMVLSGYGLPEDGAAWWTSPEVRAALFADVERKLYAGADPATVRVFELGCAGGNLLRQLAGKPRLLVGLDLSLGMLQVARGMKLPGVHLVQGDGVKLPWRDRSFDRVLCYSVVTNFPDEATVEALIGEALRVLDGGGRLLIGNTPDKRKTAEAQAAVAHLRRPVSRTRAALDYGRAVVRRLLHGPQPGIWNLSFDPEFFLDVARRHGAEARILPLDVPGYTYAPFRFDVELVKG